MKASAPLGQNSRERERVGISYQSWVARGCERIERTDCDGDRSREGLAPEGGLADHEFTKTITGSDRDGRQGLGSARSVSRRDRIRRQSSSSESLIRFHPSTTSWNYSGTSRPLRRPRLGHPWVINGELSRGSGCESRLPTQVPGSSWLPPKAAMACLNCSERWRSPRVRATAKANSSFSS